jgi:hypothetical protein
MDLIELGWDSVNWILKNAGLLVTVKAGGLTLAVWSWLSVTLNFGGLTLVVLCHFPTLCPSMAYRQFVTSVDHGYLITHSVPSLAVYL